MDIIKVLESIMYEYRLNQSQLAERLNVKPSQVSEWLSGKNKPGYDKLKAICKEFNIDANTILGLNDRT